MDGELRIFSGRVLAPGRRAPSKSVRLRLRDVRAETPLADGVSIPGGQFAIPVAITPQSGPRLVVEAVDGGEVVASQEVRDRTPTIVQLERELSEESTLGSVLLTGAATDLVSRVTHLEVSEQLPPASVSVLYAALGRLSWLDLLLEPARRAILGDPEAAAVVRSALGSWAQEIADPLPTDVRGRDDNLFTPDILISADAVGILASAVLTAGRTLEEQIKLADGLRAVLSVRSWLEVFAGVVNSGDLPAMRVMLGAPGPMPSAIPGLGGLPGGGLPGGGFPGGGLPGGGFPGLPDDFPFGKPGIGPIKVHPTVSDLIERFRSPIMLPPSEKERCLIGAMVEVAKLQDSAPAYRITGIDPADACPGARVVITGRNFGTHGSVVFPGTAAPIKDFEALEWTEGRIRVVVPTGAGPGSITLNILEASLLRCGQVFTVFRRGGSDLPFEGGIAALNSFLLNGTSDPLRVDPGGLVSISHNVTIHGSARTRVWVTQAGKTIADFGEAMGGGQLQHDFVAPTVAEPAVCIVHLVVSSHCGVVEYQRTLTVAAAPHLRIAHIEVTQGLQDAPHTVRMVSGRTTGVRAYLTSGLGEFSYTGLPGEVANVLGTLRVERGGTIIASFPSASAITVGATFTDPDRSSAQHALVFEVPGGLMNDEVTMRVSAKVTGLPGFGTETPGTSAARTVTTERGGTLAVVRLRMGLTNPAHPAGEPSVGDWQASSVGTQDRFPISDTGMQVRIPATGDVLSTNHFLGKMDGWEDALDDLDDFADRFNDFTSIFACVVPTGAFSLNGISHKAVDRPWPLANDRRCFLSQTTKRATFAHEMAHTLDIGHAPCGDPDGIDTRLPGSTEPGIIGWRTSDGQLIPPMWPELMSYCTPPVSAAWPSPTRDDRWPSHALWNILLDKLK